jgi:two-component system sensor histidine kinase AgrC
MIKMNKNNELRQYMSELMAQCSQNCNTQIYDIKNAGLFGILSSKINLAGDMGVTVDLQVSGEIESIPDVKISELCEVIGIFMDNAIEEACKCEKSISLNLKNGINFIEISFSNSCSEPPDMQKIYRDGYSSKGENRGMGLAIAKKVLGKYNNILHITSYENNMFTQTIEIVNRKGL